MEYYKAFISGIRNGFIRYIRENGPDGIKFNFFKSLVFIATIIMAFPLIFLWKLIFYIAYKLLLKH